MSSPIERAGPALTTNLVEGEAISLHVESYRGRAHLEGVIRVVGTHHIKVKVVDSLIPGWLASGDTVRIRLSDRPGYLPVSGRLARVESGRVLVLALPKGRMTANRRCFVRTEAEIPCTVFTVSGDRVEGKTLNIGGGGFLVRLREFLPFKDNENIMVVLDGLTDEPIPNLFFARVVRFGCGELMDELAMEFTEIDSRSRDAMCRFVMLCEIRERKQVGGH